MWECNCKHQNSSYYDVCQKCSEKMPQKEREKIYKKRLAFARTELGIDYYDSFEKFAKKYVGDDTITVEKLSSAFFQVLNIIRKWLKNRKKGFIIAFCICFFLAGLSSTATYQNKQIRRYNHQTSIINSKTFFTYTTAKVKNSVENVKFFFDTSQTDNLSESKQQFNQKMAILSENFEIVKEKATEIKNQVTDFVKATVKEINK